MGHVRIVQLLCPARHCVLGVAYDDREHDREYSVGFMESGFDAGAFNRRCAICGSEDLQYEEDATPWDDLQTAHPHIAECQAQQLAFRAYCDMKGLSRERLVEPE